MAFWSLFVASLVGSPHCVGMCGGFVGYVAGRYSWNFILSYHAARIFTYTILGALAGAFGEAMNNLGAIVGVETFAPLVVAVLLLSHAFVLVMGLPMAPSKMARKFHSAWGRAAKSSSPFVPPLLGALTAFLPCGWLYSFVVLAMGSGSVVQGALMLLVFGAGTLPVLVVFGGSVRKILLKTGLAPRTLTLIFLVAAGLFSLAQHLGVFEHHHH